MKRLSLIFIVLFIGLAAYAETLSSNAYSIDEIPNVPDSLEYKAKSGDIFSQCLLGFNSYSRALSKNEPQYYQKAVYWFRKAAEQGDDSAQYMLGRCYYYGRGIEQNYTEAVNWYQKAADKEYASAQNTLGCCYEWGGGS